MQFAYLGAGVTSRHQSFVKYQNTRQYALSSTLIATITKKSRSSYGTPHKKVYIS